MPSQTFPGVYTQVIDKSFANSQQSRFSCGLLGVASRGPFNTALQIQSLADFVNIYGVGIEGSFLANAVLAITGAGGDGAFVVRVGTQYEDGGIGSGSLGSYTLKTNNWANFSADDYIRVKQTGKITTPNARLASVSTGTLTLISVGVEAEALADTYTSADISKSDVPNSANEAQSFLTAPTYDSVLSSAGNIVGTKSAFEFTVSGTTLGIVPGDVVKIVQTGRATTREALVQTVNAVNGLVRLAPITNTEIGRQTLPLQDNYTTGQLFIMNNASGQVGAELEAATTGTWANTVGSNVGLHVTVSPGSNADTKLFIVTLNGAVVQTFDNLSYDPASPNYYLTALAGSDLIHVVALLGTEPPGNTVDPWNTSLASPSNIATFEGGANGANVSPSDYVGTILPGSDDPTGLQVFDDNEVYGGLFAVAVPGVSDIAVVQGLAQLAFTLNAVALIDVPDGLNAREAVDWTNGQGLYANQGRLSNYRVAFFWNWFQSLDAFSGTSVFNPPTVGVLGAMSLSFDQYKPWFAVAGEQRGRLGLATAVRYPRVRDAQKQAMYGNGNVVNPILLYRGSAIMIFGNITSLRLAVGETDKLQELSIVQLVNYIVKNMALLGRKYVFDPNDSVLLNQLTLEYTNFLETVRTERGLENYQLTCNESNNPPSVRNAHNVVVDLAIIPTDVAERIFINVTVNASGAELTVINNGVTG